MHHLIYISEMDNKSTLISEMHLGAIIVTPNNRLSNQLLRDYHERYADSSLIHTKTIQKPSCLPYQSFLRHLLNQIRHHYTHANHPLLLSALQQRHLWREILTRQTSYPCNDGLLNEIQDAWKRCQYWQIELDHPAFLQTPQTRQFQQWQHTFQQALTERSAITDDQLANYIVKFDRIPRLTNNQNPDISQDVNQVNDTLFQTPTTLIWACFDDYTPQQRMLQQTFHDQGYLQHHYDIAPNVPNAHQYPAKDRQDEYHHMIAWIQSRLAAGDQRIAVVVPDLQSQENELQRLLQRALPHDQFNMSLGKTLIDFPLIAHAIHWLSLDKEILSNHQVRLLLHSPYLIGSKTECLARADIMQHSNLLKEAFIPFDVFNQSCQIKAPKLSNALLQLDNYPSEASALTWSTHFKQRLTTLGFPGEYSLHSASYQCFQRLLALFDEFMQCAVITPIMSKNQALNALLDLAKFTVFQLKQPTTPILVLGLLEASGCTFDSIWVSGLTDQCLPQKTNLSAFIPIDLQRNRRMPHACADRELILAEQQLQRLQNACQSIVLSYPRLVGDMPNLPSPLITSLPTLAPSEIPEVPSKSSLILHDEHYCLPLLQNEKATGGTSLLANQAKCPFRAFASHRLHANPPLDVSEGPDASERGQIIHRIMELLWKQLGSQDTLRKMEPQALDQLLEEIILATIKPIAQARSLSFSTVAQDVELNRLKRLLYAALDWEKQRPAFVVEAVEHTFTIHLAGIAFQVRVDRLDRMQTDDPKSGPQKMVIDYKSSLPSKPWNEDRPEAPQLLLYALLDDSINALLFVQLKSGHLTCSGLSEQSLAIKGIQSLKKDEQWSDYQQQWHQQLTDLAHEFQTGTCAPQPTKSSTCSQCSFQSLCRIE